MDQTPAIEAGHLSGGDELVREAERYWLDMVGLTSVHESPGKELNTIPVCQTIR